MGSSKEPCGLSNSVCNNPPMRGSQGWQHGSASLVWRKANSSFWWLLILRVTSRRVFVPPRFVCYGQSWVTRQAYLVPMKFSSPVLYLAWEHFLGSILWHACPLGGNCGTWHFQPASSCDSTLKLLLLKKAKQTNKQTSNNKTPQHGICTWAHKVINTTPRLR